MIWSSSGRIDKFEYRRVSYPGMVEGERLDGIVSCEIEESAFTTLKQSGKITYEELPQWSCDLGDDLIRIYSISQLGDEIKTVCHATMLATSTSAKYTGSRKSGSLDLYSVLKILQDELIDENLTIPKGTNVVEYVSKLVEDRHLPVIATRSEAVTKNNITYEFGTEIVKVCNGLLSSIGYRSLYTDPTGAVCISPTVDLSRLTPTVRMSDTECTDCISETEFDSDFDTSEIPNKVVVISENEDGESYRGVAINDDLHSPWSIRNRHRVISRCEKIDHAKSHEQVQLKAENFLKNGMMKVETITINHLYRPLELLNAVSFEYSKAGTIGKYSVSKRKYSMEPGIPCQTSMRRFVNLAEVVKGE